MTQRIAIRFEDKSPWERRTPLAPEDVAVLVERHGLEVLLETSKRRAWDDGAFRAAGARVTGDVGDAGVVFGVKEVPPSKLLSGRVYVFFAHVIKGQRYNMPLLSRLMELGCTLVDYERITDERGQRLVFFGREAGQAGMIDALHLLGRRLAWEGFETPFAAVRPAYEYDDLAAAKEAVAELAEGLRRGVEVDDLPLVFGFTGRGRVTRGAWDVFDLLPHEEVAPEELAELGERAASVSDRVFKVRFEKEHLAQPREAGRPFDGTEYRAHPERYRGGRLVHYVPHLTVLVHGVFWTDDFPCFLTRREVASTWKAGGRKLRLLADVTCDVAGSIELTYKAVQPDNPCYVYNPVTNSFNDGLEGEGVVVLAVDNLPCELPRDASRRFSRALSGFVPAIARADYERPFAELDLPPEIKRAVIVHRGRLAPDYEYLAEHLEAWREEEGELE